jgi:hypothetical protein
LLVAIMTSAGRPPGIDAAIALRAGQTASKVDEKLTEGWTCSSTAKRRRDDAGE